MQIKEMFEKPIDRDIKGVIKVGQSDEENVYQELDEYVVTKELLKHFRDFFNNYEKGVDGYTDKMGVWISGFFGSGKSHFLKILSYLLKNSTVEGKRAIEYFTDGKKIEDPMLIAEMTKAGTIESDVMLFNIDSKGSAKVGSGKEAIVEVFMKVFNEMQGYCGSIPYLAEFERQLDNEGSFEEFKERFEANAGAPWDKKRQAFAVIQDKVVKTLVEMDFMSEEAARNWFNGTETVETSIAQLVSEIKDYVDKKPENFRLLFMIDEVGQYVGENTDHLLNLQSLIEEIGSKCEGKVWVMCTGQEALDEIIKTRQDEFSRIQARFKTRLSLSSTSADEVIQKRLLSKTDEAEEELEKVYNANDSVLRNLLKFNKDDALLDVRGFETPQEFARDFPFVPYQFLLLQKVYTAIRKHGNAGKHQSSGERSMLSGFQEAAKSVQEQDEFALVPFYKFYDTVKTSLDGAINRVIDRCQNAADEDRGIKQQDVDVLKLLYLIRYVDTDVKSTLDSIVILMADNINMDKIQMRAQVQESLDRLLSQNYIGRNGNTYNFLTDEEQDIARDIKETPVDTSHSAVFLSWPTSNVLFDL